LFRSTRRRAAFAAITALAASLLVIPGPVLASATTPATVSERVAAKGDDNPTRTKKVAYRKNWVFRSTKLRRCAFIEVSGLLVGHWRWAYRNPDGSWNHDHKYWEGFALRNPAIHVKGWPILGAGCDSTERRRIKARMSQGWYQSGCDLGVDIAVGVPWSIEFNPSYKCKKGRVGHRTSTEGPSRKTLHQWNSGLVARFDDILGPTNQGVGFSGKVVVRVHKRNASDQVSYPMHVTIK
jgi:hypothetical protein